MGNWKTNQWMNQSIHFVRGCIHVFLSRLCSSIFDHVADLMVSFLIYFLFLFARMMDPNIIIIIVVVVHWLRRRSPALLLLLLLAFQKGMKLPGSRPDVLRTKALSGPSPVGGAFGGTESQSVNALDDFELQAAHYNMACAHARLGNLEEVRSNMLCAFVRSCDLAIFLFGLWIVFLLGAFFSHHRIRLFLSLYCAVLWCPP